jgi:hypothetical protein
MPDYRGKKQFTEIVHSKKRKTRDKKQFTEIVHSKKLQNKG